MPDLKTDTFTFDAATLSSALSVLGSAIIAPEWHPGPRDQHLQMEFLNWHARNRSHVLLLSQLENLASDQASELNKFLQDRGFEPMFREFSQGGIGAAAVLDMAVNWAVEAQLTDITTYGADFTIDQFTGFKIPLHGTRIYDVGETKLVKLLTKEGDMLWLLKSDLPVRYPFDMVTQAEMAMRDAVLADTTWIDSVIAPCVEINTTTQLDWMLGLTAGDHYIDQAFQMVKIGMDEKGAYAKAASGLGTTRGMSRRPAPLIFDQPFYGWFTQAKCSVPIACFYADKDSWRRA